MIPPPVPACLWQAAKPRGMRMQNKTPVSRFATAAHRHPSSNRREAQVVG